MGILSVWGSALSIVASCLVLSACSKSESSSENFPQPTGMALQYDVGDTVYVTASQLNVRDAPRSDGQIVDSLSRGIAVEITARSAEWLKISELPRWISANHVSSSLTSQPQRFWNPVSAANEGSHRPQSTYQTRFRQEPERRAWIGKTCKKGKPCGNACIAQSRTCHK